MKTQPVARVVLAGVAGLVALGAGGAARAGDGESAASVGVGGGTWTMPGEEEDETIAPYAGPVVRLSYERGFSESMSWRIDGGGGVYFGPDGAEVSWSATVGAGLVYRFDVLKYVPYAFGELGGVVVGGGPAPEVTVDPALIVGGGLDWLRARDSSWGVEARLASFAGDTTVVGVAVRVTHRWGFF